MNPFLEAALRYIRLGWPVIPLKGKIPLTPNGSKDATLNESQARGWWARWPDANVGIATGHRFFVFDVDIKGVGEESYEYLIQKHGAFPNTIEQITGTGGKHLLFALPPDFPVRNSASALAKDIDIRGKGGYIVAAPSIHPDTKREYVWDGAQELEDQKLAQAPDWLLAWLKAGIERKGETPTGAAPIHSKLPKGERHNALLSIAGSLRRRGLNADEIYPVLSRVNQDRCDPPYEEAHLRKMADSVMQYPPDTRYNVFKQLVPPAEQQPSDEADKNLALSAPDVEAAIDEAISRKSMTDVMRLAPEVAKLRPQSQAVVIAKLREGFRDEFVPLSKWFEKALKDAAATSKGDGADEPPPATSNQDGGYPDLCGYPLTDSGNGERIVALFGKEIRYCVEMKKWLVWDGLRWAPDEMNVMRQRGKRMARILYEQSVGRSLVEKHARASESFAAITAALGSAATEKGIPISAAELDQHPYLLNCPNGVVDLRTGKLIEHDRGFLITKLCPVPFEEKARCPQFLKFIEWAMGGGDAELPDRTVRLVSFLQRAFGYALTGDVSEKAVFVFHGERGNNGKTTLLTLFRDLLGRDYSGQIVIDTVMSMRNQDATARADMADLRGVRLVVTSEVEKEHKLDEGKIKYMTAGMGNIKSCRKYENPIEFQATHKLFMDCNHRPKVRGVDDAIWNRLKLVPFDVTIPKDEIDLQLSAKLRTELPGVLAWAVRGAVAWKKDGLGNSPEVMNAGIEWREHDDPLKEFLEDACEVDDPETRKTSAGAEGGLFVQVSELAAGYAWWAKQTNERFPLGREAFTERMEAKGFKRSRSRRCGPDGKQARTWEGIQLKAEVASACRKSKGQPAWDD